MHSLANLLGIYFAVCAFGFLGLVLLGTLAARGGHCGCQKCKSGGSQDVADFHTLFIGCKSD